MLRCHPCGGLGKVRRVLTIWIVINYGGARIREPRFIPTRGTETCPTCKGKGVRK